MKFKINDTILYPVGPDYIPRQGTVVGKGRYENIYTIKTDKGELISLRADDKYDKWLESINMSRSKRKSNPLKRKCKHT
jgi:hypothetical protein